MCKVIALFLFLSFAASGLAESHNPADYPLRVHIFRRSETTFYHNRQAEEAEGEGRANLFENGKPKGIDFQFECDEKLQTSSGFETYPAKWKKPGQELVILQPKFGESSFNTCHLKIMVKDFVYVTHSGNLTTEPADVFEQWMARHAYDPEHGKSTPVQSATTSQDHDRLDPVPATTTAPRPPAPPQE